MSRKNWKVSAEHVLAEGPVIPVIVIHRLEHAVPLASALVAGGVRVLEITLRTPVAVEAIRLISEGVPKAIVGAGTVINAEELKAVEQAGALFAISPGLTPELLEAANKGGIALIPGVSTISELMTGISRGYTHFKFFPAGAAGGVKTLKAFAGPFPAINAHYAQSAGTVRLEAWLPAEVWHICSDRLHSLYKVRPLWHADLLSVHLKVQHGSTSRYGLVPSS